MKYIPDEKLCRKCKTIKPMNRFHAQARGLYGKSSQCMDCQNEARRKRNERSPGKHATYMREYRKNRRARDLSLKLKYAYGITLDDYKTMFAAQGGKCAICKIPHVPGRGRTGERLHIDHCHQTKKVRGLLCGNCNLGIGNLQHSETILLSAIEYLRSAK